MAAGPVVEADGGALDCQTAVVRIYEGPRTRPAGREMRFSALRDSEKRKLSSLQWRFEEQSKRLKITYTAFIFLGNLSNFLTSSRLQFI